MFEEFPLIVAELVSREQVVAHDAKRVDIALFISWLFIADLGSDRIDRGKNSLSAGFCQRIDGGTDEHLKPPPMEGPKETKSVHMHRAFARDKDVFGDKRQVRDTCGTGGLHRFADGREKKTDFSLRQAFVSSRRRDIFRQGDPIDKRKPQADTPVHVLHQIRQKERLCFGRLEGLDGGLNCFQRTGFPRQLLWKNLEEAVAAETPIPCMINPAEQPEADATQNGVIANHLSGIQERAIYNRCVRHELNLRSTGSLQLPERMQGWGLPPNRF